MNMYKHDSQDGKARVQIKKKIISDEFLEKLRNSFKMLFNDYLSKDINISDKITIIIEIKNNEDSLIFLRSL